MSDKNSVLRFGRAALLTTIFTGAALFISYKLNINISTEAFAGEIDDDPEPLPDYSMGWWVIDSGAPDITTADTFNTTTNTTDTTTLFASIGQLSTNNLTGFSTSGTLTLETGFLLPENEGLCIYEAPKLYVMESVGDAVVNVHAKCKYDENVVVSYTTTSGSATSGQEFTSTSGSLTIPAGQYTSSSPIEIPLLDNTLDNTNTTFTISLNVTSPSSGVEFVGQDSIEIEILDDDDDPISVCHPHHIYADQHGKYVSKGDYGMIQYTQQVLESDGDKVFGNDGDWLGAYPNNGISTGDFNGDGYTDILVGAPHALKDNREWHGKAYVLFGGDVDDNYSLDLTISGTHEPSDFPDPSFGHTVLSADINNDEYDDIVISVPYFVDNEAVGFDGGIVYVVYGSSSLDQETSIDFSDTENTPADLIIYPNLKSTGNPPSSRRFGWKMAKGDLNGDGIDDLAISEQRMNEIRVIFGTDGLADSNLADNMFVYVTGGSLITGFESTSVAFGDCNGDGFDDLVCSEKNSKKAYVVFGHASIKPSVNPGTTKELNTSDVACITVDQNDPYYSQIYHLGEVLAVDDYNFDGYDDIAFSDYRADRDNGNIVNCGLITIWEGSSSFDDTSNYLTSKNTNLKRIVGKESYDQIGFSLGFGDFQLDGYADLLLSVVNDDFGSSEINYGALNSLALAHEEDGVYQSIFSESNMVIFSDQLILDSTKVYRSYGQLHDWFGGSASMDCLVDDDPYPEVICSGVFGEPEGWAQESGNGYLSVTSPIASIVDNKPTSVTKKRICADGSSTVPSRDFGSVARIEIDYSDGWESTISGAITNEEIVTTYFDYPPLETSVSQAVLAKVYWKVLSKRVSALDESVMIKIKYLDSELPVQTGDPSFTIYVNYKESSSGPGKWARANIVEHNAGRNELTFTVDSGHWSQENLIVLYYGEDQPTEKQFDGIGNYDVTGLWVSGAGDFNGDGLDDFLIGVANAGDYNDDLDSSVNYGVLEKNDNNGNLDIVIEDSGFENGGGTWVYGSGGVCSQYSSSLGFGGYGKFGAKLSNVDSSVSKEEISSQPIYCRIGIFAQATGGVGDDASFVVKALDPDGNTITSATYDIDILDQWVEYFISFNNRTAGGQSIYSTFDIEVIKDGGNATIYCDNFSCNEVNGSGATFIVFGKEDISSIDTFDTTYTQSESPDFFAFGGTIGSVTGNNVTGIGDINDDGFDDFVTSAPRNIMNADQDNANVYVVMGASKSDWWGSHLINGGELTKIDSSGSLWDDVPGILFSDTDIDADTTLDEKVIKMDCVGITDKNTSDVYCNSTALGHGVSGIGDFNGDGIADFAIGADLVNGTDGVLDEGDDDHWNGAVYVFFGEDEFLEYQEVQDDDESWVFQDGTVTDLLNSATASGFVIRGGFEQRLGSYVSGVGDVNGDGFDDFLVSAIGNFYDSNKRTVRSRTYLIFGSDSSADITLPKYSTDSDTDPLTYCSFEFETTTEYKFFYNLAPVGDFNCDGLNDFILTDMQNIYLIYGSREFECKHYQVDFDSDAVQLIDLSQTGNPVAPIVITMFEFKDGVTPYDIGLIPHGAGDVDGDGYSDLLCGEIKGTDGFYKGAGYIILGRDALYSKIININNSSSLYTGISRYSQGINSYDILGTNQSSVGDINGDGLCEYIVNAPWDRRTFSGNERTGYVKVFSNSLSLSPPAATYKFKSQIENDALTHPKGIGMLGDGSHSVPFSRSWIGYNVIQSSLETDTIYISGDVTIFRQRSQNLNESYATVYWKIDMDWWYYINNDINSERQELTWESGEYATLCFKYTNDEINEGEINALDESHLKLYHKLTEEESWSLVLGATTLDSAKNQISVQLSSGNSPEGYYCIRDYNE
jgi:Calx-beta domain-containing protein/FG-GAP repeat protein